MFPVKLIRIYSKPAIRKTVAADYSRVNTLDLDCYTASVRGILSCTKHLAENRNIRFR